MYIPFVYQLPYVCSAPGIQLTAFHARTPYGRAVQPQLDGPLIPVVLDGHESQLLAVEPATACTLK